MVLVQKLRLGSTAVLLLDKPAALRWHGHLVRSG
jgi:hypothetical protein